MLLAIDSSTANASVALYDGRLHAEATWGAGRDHSRQLLPRIEELLAATGVTRDDLSVVGVAIGPGSFNGLRVGLATAKAICLARNLPIVGVDTLRAAAYQFRSTFRPVRPLYDAGRGEVATGLFQASEGLFGTIEEPRLATLDQALASSPPRTFFCGELKAPWREEIAARFGTESMAGPAEEPRRAGYLAELAWRQFGAGLVDDVATIQPIYLRRPAITTPTHALGSIPR
jgi:tRNA threonylcarbamoyladenosine biosynthesis protein TsaB